MSDFSAHLTDASGFSGHAERFFAPASAEEVAEIVGQANREKIPVTVSGAGTGLAGGRVPRGGWILSTEKLQKLEVKLGFAVAGAGVSLAQLQTAAAPTHQFYPPDPTEITASVGGTIAANASGSRSFLYGDTRNWVEALQVVLPTGKIRFWKRGQWVDFPVRDIRRPASTKHSAGYRLETGMDYVDLLIGSEGTLGVVTEAHLSLLPNPPALLTGVVFFPSDEAALAAVDAWRRVEGLRMLEYFDAPSLHLLRQAFPEIPPAGGAALLIEQILISDDDPMVDEWSDRIEESAALAEESWFGLTPADRERFRRFRHTLPELVNETVRRNGFMKLGTDFAVPIEANGDMMAFYRRHLDRDLPGRYVIFGHIGDAHLHVNILPQSAEDFDCATRLIPAFAAEAVRLGGTVAAEHGLGKRKAHLLKLQYTAEELASMRKVKARLDPNWILGRGTLWESLPQANEPAVVE